MSSAQYKNYTIRKTKQGYHVLGLVFPTLIAATDEIDILSVHKKYRWRVKKVV